MYPQPHHRLSCSCGENLLFDLAFCLFFLHSTGLFLVEPCNLSGQHVKLSLVKVKEEMDLAMKYDD